MVLFIRDNECFEPRVRNYLHYFDDHGIDYHVIAWNRNGSAKTNNKITFFNRRAEYGKRIANIPNKLLWMFFVIKNVFKYRKETTVIHACDIDAVLPALFAGKLCRKKIIWDIFDWISSPNEKGIVYSAVEALQNYSYRHADYVILCEKEREEQAKVKRDDILVLPNIPDGKFQFDSEVMSQISEQRKKYKYTLSYVGVFDRDRGLENLLECVSSRPDILLNIAGFGVLDGLVREYAEKYANICYFGRVEYSVGQSVMKSSDMMIAMYHMTSPLHKYAAPNKYYESLYLEVPMITTENTLVASKAARYDTGFVISEGKRALDDLLSDTELNDKISAKKSNCRKTWTEVYSTYYEDFMRDIYRPIVK